MSQSTDAATDPLAQGRPDGTNRRTAWRIELVRVPSGVAAGSSLRLRGNARTESWTLFSTREEFHACSTSDPLRFSDPLLFAQLTREFDHVFDRPDPHDARCGVRPALHRLRPGP
jgi:hypothetical protein